MLKHDSHDFMIGSNFKKSLCIMLGYGKTLNNCILMYFIMSIVCGTSLCFFLFSLLTRCCSEVYSVKKK